jgi:tRNA pseudouridine55 synthase
LNGITHSDKSYTAVLSLGTGTDTLDTEGNVTDQKQVPALTVEKIESVLHSFLGKTMQIPPMFSAKKINGTRLYKLARKNIEIDRKPVEIHVRDIQFLDYCDHKITFTVICSKGTYIRVLGKDIAEKLDTVGHLTSLIRTRVGGYSIDESQTIEHFKAKWTS